MRGIIAEVKNKKAVFLSESGEFYTIVNKNYEVGEKVEYSPGTYRSLYSIAACFIIIIFCGFTGYSMYNTPTTYISIDINPSIQLDINRFNKIIEAHPINEDAKTLLETIKVKNNSISEAVDKIIEASKYMGYLNEKNNHVEIDIVSQKSDVIEQVGNDMNKYVSTEINVHVEKADENDMALSNELGISIGRAKAIREYTEFYGGDTRENAEELSDLSVGEVKKSVKKNKADNNNKTGDVNKNINGDMSGTLNNGNGSQEAPGNENSGVNTNNDKKPNENESSNSSNGKKSNDNDSSNPVNDKKSNDNDSSNSSNGKKLNDNDSSNPVNDKKSNDNDSTNPANDKKSNVNDSRNESIPKKNNKSDKIKEADKSESD